jgi:chemotaxis-related protein WspD
MSDPLPILEHGQESQLTAARDCWNQIGISGDRSCPELQIHVHCRNCPVFAASARAFFDRPAPEHYLAEWTRWLAGSAEAAGPQLSAGPAVAEGQVISVLIFRLGQEWMAFPTQSVAEVTLPGPVHRIPHRSSSILTGLVNLRGQLQLCISLHGLLGVSAAGALPGQSPAHESTKASDNAGAAAASARLIVLRDRERSESWVFVAEEVIGVERLPRSQMGSVSSALANPEVSFSQATLSWNDRSVSFLDEQRVFAALRSIGQ